MSRWPADAGDRLHAAAVELFLERGFAATTVPQIAERAGLTTRSFFRYYADKREVLFVGEEQLPGVVERVFAGAEAALAPMEVIEHGLRDVVAPRVQNLREELLNRHRISRGDEGLQERHLRKLAILQDAAAQGFRSRGLGPLDAQVAARIAVTVFDGALSAWLEGENRPFGEAITDVMAALVRVARVQSSAGLERPTAAG
ncbi:MAG: TetR family transcriptional regulator [Pseudonocardia sp.]|nr:TetR family transcriptional regulator [Pseudonocardia sp.]